MSSSDAKGLCPAKREKKAPRCANRREKVMLLKPLIPGPLTAPNERASKAKKPTAQQDQR